MIRKIENLERALHYMMEQFGARPIKAMKNFVDKKWYGKTGGYYISIQGEFFVIRFRKNVFEIFDKYYRDTPFYSKGCGLNKTELLRHQNENVYCLEILPDGKVLMVSPQDAIDFVLEYKTLKKLPDMQDTIYNIPLAIMNDFNEYFKTKKYISWKQKFGEVLKKDSKQKTLM